MNDIYRVIVWILCIFGGINIVSIGLSIVSRLISKI